ncbi:MAG: hypothetical protein WB290_00765 [Smithella sp.]
MKCRHFFVVSSVVLAFLMPVPARADWQIEYSTSYRATVLRAFHQNLPDRVGNFRTRHSCESEAATIAARYRMSPNMFGHCVGHDDLPPSQPHNASGGLPINNGIIPVNSGFVPKTGDMGGAMTGNGFTPPPGSTGVNNNEAQQFDENKAQLIGQFKNQPTMPGPSAGSDAAREEANSALKSAEQLGDD